MQITNINLSSDLNSRITPSHISRLLPHEKVFINLSISVSSSVTSSLSGNIFAKFDGNSTSIPVLFQVTKNSSNINLNDTSTTVTASCYNLGNLCAYNEDCDGEKTASLEGPCCIGKCVQKTQSNSTMWWGILILVLVVGVVGYLIWNARKKQTMFKSAESIIKERAIREKPKDLPESSEVKGSLGKI